MKQFFHVVLFSLRGVQNEKYLYYPVKLLWVRKRNISLAQGAFVVHGHTETPSGDTAMSQRSLSDKGVDQAGCWVPSLSVACTFPSSVAIKSVEPSGLNMIAIALLLPSFSKFRKALVSDDLNTKSSPEDKEGHFDDGHAPWGA